MHADPAGDIGAPLLALEASMVIRGSGGERTVAAGDFFEDLFQTAVGDGELLTAIRIPKHDGWGAHYEKFVRVSHQWAIVAVAATVRLDGGRIAEARIGLTNMGSTPLRAKAVEAWESFIDEVAERTAKPTAEQALQFKEAFHRLDKADQMDGIQTALNLLPDEQFSLMYPILFDKAENADVLDEIFSDGLNRDEDIKVPMMKELYKDKEHPMFVEAARILDATGELDEMNGEKEEKEE